jgi:hypothetical protein
MVLVSVPASATLVADYQFIGNLSSSVSGAPDLASLGGGGFVVTTVDGVGVQGWGFPEQTGLDLDVTGLVGSDEYTVVMLLEAQEVYEYAKLLDTQDRVPDEGLYYEDYDLEFYDEDSGTSDLIVSGQYYQVAVTRDVADNYIGYIDGVQQLSFTDSSDYAVITGANRLVFFRDDFDTSDGENTAGTVVRIRIYDNALSPGEVAALDRLTEAQTGALPVPALGRAGVVVLIALITATAVFVLRRRF